MSVIEASQPLAPPGAFTPPKIEHADYRDFLAGLAAGEAALALTDPPYAISRKTGFANVKNGVDRFAVSMDFGEWDHAEIDLDALASGLYRVLRRGGTAIVWYDLWKIGEVRVAFEAAGFGMFRQVLWQKTNPVPLNSKCTYLSNSREAAVACVKGGKPVFHGEYDNGIYALPIPRHNGKRVHPTQKPLGLFVDLVLKHSDPDDLVIDPFLGSGTTAVAAVGNGRRFAGCDLDRAYVDAACSRLGVSVWAG